MCTNSHYLDVIHDVSAPQNNVHHTLPAVLGRLKALMRREFVLVKRNLVLYKMKVIQVLVLGLVAATLFLRKHIHPISPNDGQEIAGFLFFSTLAMLFNGIADLSMTVCPT